MIGFADLLLLCVPYDGGDFVYARLPPRIVADSRGIVYTASTLTLLATHLSCPLYRSRGK